MIDRRLFATETLGRTKDHTLPVALEWGRGSASIASLLLRHSMNPSRQSTSLRSSQGLFRCGAVVLLALMAQGCFVSRSTTNPVIPAEAVAQIQPGQSNADDVARLLGAPNEVVQLGRRTAWRYEHTVEKQTGLFLVLLGLRGVDTQADRVWVFFDEEDNVSHIGSLLQASEAEYDLPVF